MKDTVLLISGWLITIILLIAFVPKNKFREANVLFLSNQFATWISGTIVAEMRLVVYPVRSFPYAYKGSFDFEYFIYPSFCVLFNLHYPENRSRFRQFMHYFYYCTGLTLVEVIAQRYTNIIKYINWNWYVTWITLFLTFFITHRYYVWFFKTKERWWGILLPVCRGHILSVSEFFIRYMLSSC